MRVTAKRLRRWVMGAAVLLLAVVIGFVFHGRYRFRHIARDLPGRLGMNIQQTATGFSYSQSSQGHTLFTLKASKEFQLKSGHVLLHNVDITLYGPPGSGRTDHIFGSDFDYDQSQGIAISHSEVRIQLEALSAGGTKPDNATAAGANEIQVQTSGLRFVQKTEQASTRKPVHFELPRAAGSAIGADYNAKTGVLVLDSQVHITTNSNGKAATIDAAQATLERARMQALLTDASLDYGGKRARADQATVDFRKDGTAEKIDAQGHVLLATEQGATTKAATAVILLNAKSQPLRTDLGGGVTFTEAKTGERMQGWAESGTLLFAAAPGAKGTMELRHAEFRKNVRLTQEVTGNTGNNSGPAARELDAQRVDAEFAETPGGQPMAISKAVAQGSPVMTMRQEAANGTHAGLAQTTRISGNELVATLGSGNALRELDGTGHTLIESASSDGARETSRGNTLRATFAEQPALAGSGAGSRVRRAEAERRGISGSGGVRTTSRPAPKMQTVLETAVQDGNVSLTEIPASHAAGPGAQVREPLMAWAEHAEYHAADEVLTLTGHPHMREGETMQMSAERILYHRDTQDAEGEGDVKATYTQAAQGAAGRAPAVPEMGANEPVHVIAERAEMHHASGGTVFYGTVSERARMWQGPDSLLAPTIEIDRSNDRLKAWGQSTRPEVLANFTSAMGTKHEQTLVSVASRRLDYSDKSRQADFQGEVTAEQGNEAIRADDALVILKPEQEASSRQTGKRNSEIEKVITTGHVVFTQPGRRGEGSKLVYTTGDGKYVLTGTPGEPPRLWDRVHGTTTGAALIFNSQNDSVEVSGGKSSAVTETRAPR